MSTSAIPAAPTARDPVLRAPSPTGARLSQRVPVAQLRVMFLGFTPVSAAAAVMLAGCGARGFVVVDPQPVTWDDARAGAYDVPDVGLARELVIRQRIRAANPAAAPIGDPAGHPSRGLRGTLVVRSRDFTHRDGDGLDPRLEAASAHLSEDHRVIDVATPAGHAPGTTVLWPPRPWHARACGQCLARAAGISGPEPARAPRHDVWPAHTAMAASVLVQQIVAVAGGSADDLEDRVTVIRPGAPLSAVGRLPTTPAGCALCAASWSPGGRGTGAVSGTGTATGGGT
ncbi:hypothetical protein FCK90_00610 [Kocuria coralli]|uniref:Thiamine biosynthesis protein ThiF n=1 Tax=Kocuria coralli TaxID=1461025 RepID=A0A5J5L399_9MICC|nr:hypothetical protein [Kocuria coralli]KAA9395566.1 hypothetical protein FCK90_00610 [Kocuria coralli]